MIYPAPTTKLDPGLARGVLEGVLPATAAHPAMIVVSFPNSSYQLHLIPGGEIATPVGARIIGRIRAAARRVDEVGTGGSYVEPVYGHPRRVQGRVLGTDEATRTVVVDAGGMPIHLALTDERQSPAQFRRGDLVSTDVLDGTSLTPVA